MNFEPCVVRCAPAPAYGPRPTTLILTLIFQSLVPSSTSSAVRILCTPPPSLVDSDDPRCSTPIKRRGRSTSPLMRPSSLPNNHLGSLADDDDVRTPMTRVNIKQEGAESGSVESSPDEARRSKLARIDVVDAESNTINSGECTAVLLAVELASRSAEIS